MATTKLHPLGHDKAVSFRRLMSLKEIDNNSTFESLTEAYAPPETGSRRAYGGHVFAQAAYAASRTVPKGLVIHHVSGNWVAPGLAEMRFRYLVRRIRDGATYSLRIVEAYQNPCPDANDDPTLCFVGIVAFKRADRLSQGWENFRYQAVPKNYLTTEYGKVLTDLQFEDHRLLPDHNPMRQKCKAPLPSTVDAPRFPGLETWQVDMARYNTKKRERGGGANGVGAAHIRQLHLYRIVEADQGPRGAFPCSTSGEIDHDDLNLDAAAHLYAADRHALFLIPDALGYENPDVIVASLALTVVLHHPVEPLRTLDARGRSKLFVQEAWTTQGSENRGTHESRVFDYKTGRIVSSTLQDGLVKVPAINVEDYRLRCQSGPVRVKL